MFLIIFNKCLKNSLLEFVYYVNVYYLYRFEMSFKTHTLTYAMKLSSKEQLVIQLLGELKVGTKTELCQKLNISHMTVVRAIKKYGYYSSYNKNSSYYTLKHVPEFNISGLWFYKEIGFSRHKNINCAILFVIKSSTNGYTEKELSSIFHTKTGNILCRLIKQKRIDKYQKGRSAIYISADETKRRKQLAAISSSTKKNEDESKRHNITQGILPSGFEVKVVLITLVSLIEKPESTVASISISLQRDGIQVSASQIKTIMSFYGIIKSRYYRNIRIIESNKNKSKTGNNNFIASMLNRY